MPDTQMIEWTADGQTFEGLLATPDGEAKGAVLVCHAWAGRAPHENKIAAMLAHKGYIALAGDVYGKGVLGTSNEENEKLMTPLASDRAGSLQTRLRAALKALTDQPGVDPSKVAAAGFCFGGLAVLDLARTHAPLRGVAAFHAIVSPMDGAPTDPIKPKVIAFQGFDDPMAGPADLKAFGEEMTAREADWQLVSMGGVSHAFTNEEANMPDMGLKFDPTARDRSYAMLDLFLGEIFA